MVVSLRRMGHVIENSPGNLAAQLRGPPTHGFYAGPGEHTDGLLPDGPLFAGVAYSGQPGVAPGGLAPPRHAPWIDDVGAGSVPPPPDRWGVEGWGTPSAAPAQWQANSARQSAYHGHSYEPVPPPAPYGYAGWEAWNSQQAYPAWGDQWGGDGSDNGTDTDTVSSLGDGDYDPPLPYSSTPAELYESLYWAYQRAKANFRRYSQTPVRAVRRFIRRKGFGRGKGRGSGFTKGHGKGHPRGKGHQAIAFLAELPDAEVEHVFKGKGKGKRSSGKGKGRRGNPLGRMGTP